MINKKTSTPLKKAATKKKGVTPKVLEGKLAAQLNLVQPTYLKHLVEKYGSVVPDAVALGAIAAPAGETRISELEAENYALKTLLSKHQSDQMQNKQSLPERTTMLSQFATEFDGQLSRLYNSLNLLGSLANRLNFQKEDQVKGNAPEAHDLSSRLSNLLGYFSQQNDRLDLLNSKLSDLI